MLNFFYRQPKRIQFAILLLISIIAVIFQSGFYTAQSWTAYGLGDWDLTYSMAEIARKSITEYNQLPLWNPYSCGGLNYHGNPQTFHLGPFFFLSFFLSIPVALKLQIIIYIGLGFWGMFLLLKHKGIDIIIAFLTAGTFTFTTYFTWHSVYAGHHNSLLVNLLPWIILAYEYFKANGFRYSIKSFLIPVICYAVFVLDGASYPIVYTPVFVFGFILTDGLVQKKAILRRLLYFILSFIAGLGISAWKLLPSIHLMSKYPREYLDKTHTGLMATLQIFAEARPENKFNSFSYWSWHEYGAAFSIIAVLIIIVFIRKLNTNLWWFLFAFLLVWFCIGNFPAEFNPWYLLQQFAPGFKSMRAPGRMIIYLIFFLSICFGLVANKLKKYRAMLIIILMGWWISLFAHNRSIAKIWSESKNIENAMSVAPQNNKFQQIKLPPDVFEKGYEGLRRSYPFVKENFGILNAIEPIPIEKASFLNDSMENIGLLKADHVRLQKFTPSIFSFQLDEVIPFAVYQNYAEGWMISEGSGDIKEKYGQIWIEPKSKNIEISFVPPILKEGFIISMVFIAALLIFSLTSFITNRKLLQKPSNKD